MNKTGRAVALTSAGLVAGLVLGSIGVAVASTASSPASSTAASGLTAPAAGPGRDGGKGGFGGIGDIAEAVSNLTGISVSDVESKRAAGSSYESIAKAEGVSAAQVLAETLKIEKAELAAAVKAGTLTQAQSDSIGSSMEANIKTAISSTDAMRGPGGPGGPRHGDREGDGPGAASTPGTSSGTSSSTSTSGTSSTSITAQ